MTPQRRPASRTDRAARPDATSHLGAALEALQDLGLVYRRIMTARARAPLASRRLSPLATCLLYHVAQHGPRSPSVLADELAMARPNATVLVHELGRMGLVVQRSLRGGHQRTLVDLSPKGRDTVRGLRELHLERLRAVLQRMSPAELRLLDGSARRVVSILDRHLGLRPGSRPPRLTTEV